MDEQSRPLDRSSQVLGTDGVLRITYESGAVVDLDEARRHAEVSLELSGGYPRPALVDIRQMRSITRDARTYFAGEENARAISRCALLVGSPISVLIGNFFMGLNKPKMPTRLFTSEDDALAWLQEPSG